MRLALPTYNDNPKLLIEIIKIHTLARKISVTGLANKISREDI